MGAAVSVATTSAIATTVAAASWYASIIRPTWAPPAWLFSPVWTVLYILIIVSFGYVFYLATQKKIGFSTVLPFVINLVANLAYSPIQFGLRSFGWASLDIVIVLGTIVWFMVAIWREARWVALINIPYLAWVSFATVLQMTITYLNVLR